MCAMLARRNRSASLELTLAEEQEVLPEQRDAYQQVCQELNLDARTMAAGMRYLKAVLRTKLRPLLEDKRPTSELSVFIASALFLACDQGAWNGVRVTQLVRETSVSLRDLLQFTELISEKLNVPATRQHVKEFDTNYTTSSLLFDKFKQLWLLITHLSEDSALFRLTWQLFSVVKATIKCTAVADGTHYLLSCLYFVLMNVVMARIDSYSVPSELSPSSTVDDFIRMSGLQLNADTVREGIRAAYTTIRDLKRSGHISGRVLPLVEMPGDASEDDEDDDVSVFHTNRISSMHTALHNHYQSHCLRSLVNLDDEVFLDQKLLSVCGTPTKVDPFYHNPANAPKSARRLFNNDEDSKGRPPLADVTGAGRPRQTHTPMRPPPGSVTATPGWATPLTAAFARAPSFQSPSRDPTATPVSASLQASNWLQNILDERTTQPSNALQHFFAACPTNPMADIMQRVVHCTAAIVSPDAPTLLPPSSDTSGSTDSTATEARATPTIFPPPVALPRPTDAVSRSRDTGIRLYLLVLERLLVSEQERCGTNAFPALLSNDPFHRALLTCSLEIVLHSMNLTRLEFPHLMTLTGVRPFDLLKVIESFVKVLDLPDLLKLRILHVQDQLLEELIWKSDSNIWPALHRKTATGTAAPPLPVAVVLKKLQRLAAHRIERLCDCMRMLPKQIDQVWTLVQHILENPEGLLKDRHLDQLIMCSVYAIYKINNSPMKFNTIIHKYNEVFRSSAALLTRQVLLKDGEIGDIVGLYNSEFVAQLKGFILGLREHTDKPASAAGAAAGAPTPSVALSPLPRTHASPTRVINGNIHCSPRAPDKMTRTDLPMTPGTRAIYAFGESPGQRNCLPMINHAVNRTVFPLGGTGPLPSTSPGLRRIIQSSMRQDRDIDMRPSLPPHPGHPNGLADDEHSHDDHHTSTDHDGAATGLSALAVAASQSTADSTDSDTSTDDEAELHSPKRRRTTTA